MEKYRVFYSWQSDLPNAANRSFIEKALEDAAKDIRADESVKIEPVIDRDTVGVPGSPDIANTIFAKIEQAQVFACDVSITNQGEKSRKTPNPNVLIELGYALKTLSSDRILMIMNTAFGPPEQLPFDLSKKRVVTYNMPDECKDRATERKALTSKLQAALRTIFAEISKQARVERTEKSLQEKSSEIVERDNIVAWRQLIEGITDEIVEKLLAWKQTGEAAISEVERSGQTNWEPWKAAFLGAVKISVPGSIPILTAIQKGKKDYYEESVVFLQRLAHLRDEMIPGTEKVTEIANPILYIAGAIGMALAVRRKQLDFLVSWGTLTMPEYTSSGWVEKPWWQIYSINGWNRGPHSHKGEPYSFIAKLFEMGELQSFFESPEQLRRSLFAGNLLLSMLEFRQLASEPGYYDYLSQEPWLPHIKPFWALMELNDFTKETLRIFGSSTGVLNFAYPGIMATAEKFWPLWQAWKKKCVQLWTSTGDQTYWRCVHNIYGLDLPGEPPIQT
jgi:hypothetical protein